MVSGFGFFLFLTLFFCHASALLDACCMKIPPCRFFFCPDHGQRILRDLASFFFSFLDSKSLVEFIISIPGWGHVY